MKLLDRIAIITGGSTGIGKAIATAFAAEGANLVLTARTPMELIKTQKEIKDKYSIEVEVFPGDISKITTVNALVHFTMNRFQTISILVNSAGIYGPIGLITDVDSKKWIDTININLCGTFLCMQAVLPIMLRNKKGKIINMSGGGGASPLPRFSAYGTSKAAVIRLTETIAEEIKGSNIDINAIAPGAVNTQLLDQVISAGEAAGSEILARSLTQKKEGGIPPEKVAELAVYLASSESDGLSGKLISLLWDNWKDSHLHLDKIMKSDIYTMRRIVPKDRGGDW